MHILILPSERYLPPENHLSGIFQLHQAEMLITQGHCVGILSPPELQEISLRTRIVKGLWQDRLESAVLGGINVVRLFGWMWSKRFADSVTQRIWAAIAGFRYYIAHFGRPDVLHAHSIFEAGIYSRALQQRFRVPYILTEHSSQFALAGIPAESAPLVRMVLKGARVKIVVSPRLGKDMAAVFGDAASPWQYVPNVLAGVFEAELAPVVPPGPGMLPFCFVTVGNLEENKAHHNILMAFASQFRGRSDVILRVVGDGPLRSRLEQQAKDLGVSSQVIFEGQLPQDQVRQVLIDSTVYVHASHYETFGVAIIEALACGKPVISTACGGPEYIVRDADGLLVPVGDVMALAGAMAAMTETVASYDSAAIRRDCLARFGAGAVGEQLTAIYRRVLAGPDDK